MARVLWSIEVREASGSPIATASITLTQRVGGAAVTHWSAETAGTSSSAAFTTDANGRAARWVDPGSYNAAISKAGRTTINRAFDAVRGDSVNLIADDSVKNAQFGDNAVTAAKITSNAVTNVKLANLSVTEPKLANDAVSTRTIVAANVTNAKINDSAVTTAKIVDRSVGTTEIDSGSVGGGTVGTNELAAGAVTVNKLTTAAVETAHIQNEQITTAKIGNNAISSDRIAPRAIKPWHLESSVLPIGTILPTANDLDSGQWLLLDNRQLTRAAYPQLADVIMPMMTGTFTSGSAVVTNLPSTTHLGPAMSIWVNGLSRVILTVDSGTQITMTTTFPSSTATYSARFYWNAESIVTGDDTVFKLPDLRGRSLIGVGTEAGVVRLGQDDKFYSLADNVRGAKHGHSLGTLAISGNGAHQHYSYVAGDYGVNAYGVGAGPDHVYDGQVLAGDLSDGAHTHVGGGIIGDLSSIANTQDVHHQALNYIIKADPVGHIEFEDRFNEEAAGEGIWWNKQTAPGSLNYVSSPVFAPRTRAMRNDLLAGDIEPVTGNYRSELTGHHIAAEGAERWFRMPLRVATWHLGPWGLVWQQHIGAGSPPLALFVRTATAPWALRLANGITDENHYLGSALNLNQWYDIVVGVKWSTNATVGWVEIWVDGVQQTVETGGGVGSTTTRRVARTATTSAGDYAIQNYDKLGLYSDVLTGGQARDVYHGMYRVGTSRLAVM